MRNLKRVLSLALASAMLLGMMVMGAGAADKTAADLTDIDKVTNKDAVNLMVDLKVITGKPDGSYAPTETVDRATMSTLIYKIMTGETDASAFKGASSTLIDVKGTWAEGFINYCGSMKIVNGDGTKFYPENKVTVAQAAKMLLVAIGYDADLSKYSNDSMWSVNVMRDAQKAGLTEGVSQKASDELTRDNAAKMVFNTIFAEIVLPKVDRDQGVAYLSGYEGQKTTLSKDTYKLEKIEATVTSIDKDGKAVTAAVSPAVGNNALLTGKLSASPEQVGAKVIAYSNTATGKLVSTSLSTGASTVLGTSMDGTTLTKLTTKGDSKYIASLNTTTVAYFVNGKTDAAGTIGTSIKAGSIVELVDNGKDGDVDVVRVTKKSMTTLTADPVVSSDKVTISSIPGLAKIDTAKVTGYSDLKKDDVVLYVQVGDKFFIEKAAVVENTVSGQHSTKGLLIDGTYYLGSGLVGTNPITGWTDFTNTYKFYLDNGKNIIKTEKVTDGATASHAVVTDVAWVAGSGVEGTNYVEAKLLFTDGTTKVVKVATVDGVKAVPTTNAPTTTQLYSTATAGTTANTHYKKGTGSAAVGAAKTYIYAFDETTDASNYKLTAKAYTVAATADLTASADLRTVGVSGTTYTSVVDATAPVFIKVGQFYSYTIDANGSYVLTAPKLTNGSSALGTLGAKIDNNTAQFDASNIGNASTVFLYAIPSGDTVKYTVYTGIANAPKTTTTTNPNKVGAVVKNDAGFATFVYVQTASTTATTTDWAYFTSKEFVTMTVSGTTYYQKDAIINGKAGTVKVADSDKAVTGMYSIDSVSDTGISTISNTTPEAAKKVGIKGNSGSTIITGDGTGYVYDGDTEAFYIDADGDVTAMTPDSLAKDGTNLVYVRAHATTGIATTIYVIEVGAKPVSLIVTGGSGTTIADGTSDASNATKDLLKGAVTASGAATKTVIVTAAATDYMKYTVEISGEGIAVTSTPVAAFDTAVAATYALVAGDNAKNLTVKVTATDEFSGNVDVLTYTIAATIAP